MSVQTSCSHERSVTSHTLSLLSITAESNAKGEQQTGSQQARGGEVILHISTTVDTLHTDIEKEHVIHMEIFEKKKNLGHPAQS